MEPRGIISGNLYRVTRFSCHGDSRKWYGLIMDVPAEKLGMSGKNVVDIIEIKCDPILSGSLTGGKGIRPAYHMKQGSWISVLLDGSVEKTLVFSLLDMSYKLTSKRRKGKELLSRTGMEWIVPVNLSITNLQKRFRKMRKSSGSKAAIFRLAMLSSCMLRLRFPQSCIGAKPQRSISLIIMMMATYIWIM